MRNLDTAYPLGKPTKPTAEQLARHQARADERLRKLEAVLPIERQIVDDAEQQVWIREEEK